MNTATIDVDTLITPSSTNYLKNPFTFTGREYDEETGCYYYRARYYCPDTGRFLSEDPIGFAGLDENLYRYVFNNPTNYIDPNGTIIKSLFQLIRTFLGFSDDDILLAPIKGAGPSCLNEGEDELLRQERARQDYERDRSLIKEQYGIDIGLDLPQEPPLFTPADYLNPNPPDISQPQLKQGNRQARRF